MALPTPRCSRAGWIATVVLTFGLAMAALFGAVERRQQRRIATHIKPLAARQPTLTAPGRPLQVGPTTLAAMTPEQARNFNAALPFINGPIAPATPFVYVGTPEDRAAAKTCLAAAVLYEAGDDALGEQAVAQVVLNRLRHPAFPKTVCGVVFQGSERRTGCQFTFTCDGSLARSPGLAAWKSATRIADAALSGVVFKKVGTATYYHADWVVPYWRAKLDKLAEVSTQIFYRWPGAPGRPAAFTGRPRRLEQLDLRIAALAPPGLVPFASADSDIVGADGAPFPARTSLSIAGVPRLALKRNIVRLKDDDAAQYVVQLDRAANPGSYAVLGFTICSDKPNCLVLGWTSAEETPRRLPVLPLEMRSVAFIYRKSSLLGLAQPLWDCGRFPRALRSQCVPGSDRRSRPG